MKSLMRVIVGAALTAAALAGPAAAQAAASSFPCTPPEDVCAVDYVYDQPGVGTGNIIQTPVDVDLNVKP